MKAKQLFKSRAKCYKIGISTISEEKLHPAVKCQIESKEPRLKCRYAISAVGFTIFAVLCSYRMNISVGIVAMVNNSALLNQAKDVANSCPLPLMNLTNETNISGKSYSNTGEFNWSPEIQGYIHGSYYLTYLTALIPMGKLVEKYGCKWSLFWGTFVAAIANLLIPVVSRIHPYGLILVQILRALGMAVYQPSGSLLAANWFPKMERGLLYSAMKSGASLGAFLGSIFSGLLCKSSLLGGWPLSFYAFGIVGLILTAAIAYFVHENPSVHPRISEAELKYILSNQENALPQRRPDPPWRKIFSSVPVYALALGYFGQNWAISQFLIVHSTFLGTILHYTIEQNGYLSAFPFLLMFLFSSVTSSLSSFLTNRKFVSVDRARKSCNLMASLGYSLCLLGIYFAGCCKFWSITFAILSVGFVGVGFSGCSIVAADMSPTFAASIHSITFTFGCLPSFILPLVVGAVTDGRQTLEQWNKVFYIGIGVVMTSGLIFSIFGSAEVQPWNFVEEDQKNTDSRY